MPKMKIKKNDTVIIISGDEKGKTGVVKQALPKESKVIVEGINMVKRHKKPVQGQSGGIITKEAAIHVSNVALVKDGKPTKVGYKTVDGKKVRVARKTGDVID
jgi:large subunit ribosomal protein L24